MDMRNEIITWLNEKITKINTPTEPTIHPIEFISNFCVWKLTKHLTIYISFTANKMIYSINTWNATHELWHVSGIVVDLGNPNSLEKIWEITTDILYNGEKQRTTKDSHYVTLPTRYSK